MEKDSLTMTLDEIIVKKKIQGFGNRFEGRRRRGRNNGGRKRSRSRSCDRFAGDSGGREGKRRGREWYERIPKSSKSADDKKWYHDKFHDLEADELIDDVMDEAETGQGVGEKSNRKVRVFISNLADSVTTGDLEELFEDYGLSSCAVHFDDDGRPLGSGDVEVRRLDAARMLNDFVGVGLDGQLLKLSVVGASLAGRIKLVSGGRSRKKRTPSVIENIPLVGKTGKIIKQRRSGVASVVMPRRYPSAMGRGRGARVVRSLSDISIASGRRYARRFGARPLSRPLFRNVKKSENPTTFLDRLVDEKTGKREYTIAELDRDLDAYMKGAKPKTTADDAEKGE